MRRRAITRHSESAASSRPAAAWKSSPWCFLVCVSARQAPPSQALTPPPPDLRQALRARGVSPAGSRNVRVERLIQTLIEVSAATAHPHTARTRSSSRPDPAQRGESMPPDPETAGPADPQPRSSGAGSHVGYLFGQPERDAPDNLGGLASPGAPRGRKSFAVAASVPFGTTADLQATTEKLSEAQLSGSLPCASPAPFKTDEQARFPARSSLPSAPPPPQSDAAVERALSSISKMTVRAPPLQSLLLACSRGLLAVARAARGSARARPLPRGRPGGACQPAGRLRARPSLRRASFRCRQ